MLPLKAWHPLFVGLILLTVGQLMSGKPNGWILWVIFVPILTIMGIVDQLKEAPKNPKPKSKKQ